MDSRNNNPATRSRPIPVTLNEEDDGGDDGNDHDDIDDHDQDGHLWSSFFSSSYPRANSFGNLRSMIMATNHSTNSPSAETAVPPVESKWSCVSPMTHHIIRESTTPQIRRRRSRSFSDYIDSSRRAVDLQRRHPLQLPALQEQQHLQPPEEEPATILVSTSGALSPAIEVVSSYREDDVLAISSRLESPVKGSMPQPQSSSCHDFFISLLYGMINATIVIPVVMSFGNIIYQDASFQPYIPTLIKLTMVSGVVHQLCFSTLSSLTFAVGSVQDAGLIFLSSMASDMVQYCQAQEDCDDSVLLATVTVGLGVAAFVLGCGLIIVGRLQLAGYVQMLPTCVVAGYLAYIGFFCGKSGLGIMASSVVMDDTPAADATPASSDLTWQVLVEHRIFVLPGVLGGLFIYWSVRTFRHVAVLPTCILILLMCFYAGLAVEGISIEQATDRGWIRKAEPAPVWYRTWDYLKLDKVIWSALPRLLLTEVSMLFVVALSSSLDVAAIELELKRPLNYNKELTMVGISNVISGLTGGYTGSYIFSQSIFSLRSGIQSRVAGFCLAACQILVIVTPFPILSFVPNFFYGSLLGMICLDLMIEWLWDFRTKVTIAEYIIGLSTFGLIQWLGVEYGILAGVVMYIACRQLGIPVGELKMVTDENQQQQALEAEQDDKAVLLGEKAPLMIQSSGGGDHHGVYYSNGMNGSSYHP